jgi:hypothetical protein
MCGYTKHKRSHQNNIRLTLQKTTTSNMCQQNSKRIKDLLLLAGGDVATYDNPFELQRLQTRTLLLNLLS